MQPLQGLLDDGAGSAHVEPHVASPRGAEHRALVEREASPVDEEVDHLLVLQPQPGAVEPQQESRLGLDGNNARQVLVAILHDEVDVALDVAQALVEPLLAVAIGSLGGDDRRHVGIAQFVGLDPAEEGLAQLGVLDHAPRTLEPRDVEGLAGRATGDGDGCRLVADGGHGGVLVAIEHQVAEDLVREDDYSILVGQPRHLAQHVDRPGDAGGVVGVAQHQHARMLVLEDALQPLEVHAIEARLVGQQGVVDHHAPVARNHVLEGMVDGLLDDDLVAWPGEEVHRQTEARDDACHKGDLVAREVEAVAAALPVDDRLPIGIVGAGVAIDGVIGQPPHQRLGDLGADGKIHVGYPQRQQVVAPVVLFEYFNFFALRTMTINA